MPRLTPKEIREKILRLQEKIIELQGQCSHPAVEPHLYYVKCRYCNMILRKDDFEK